MARSSFGACDQQVQQLLAGQVRARLLQRLGGGLELADRFLQSPTDLGLAQQLLLHLRQLLGQCLLPAAQAGLQQAAEQDEELLIEKRRVVLDQLAAHVRRGWPPAACR